MYIDIYVLTNLQAFNAENEIEIKFTRRKPKCFKRNTLNLVRKCSQAEKSVAKLSRIAETRSAR